jgi:hypothetical protein
MKVSRKPDRFVSLSRAVRCRLAGNVISQLRELIFLDDPRHAADNWGLDHSARRKYIPRLFGGGTGDESSSIGAEFYDLALGEHQQDSPDSSPAGRKAFTQHVLG